MGASLNPAAVGKNLIFMKDIPINLHGIHWFSSVLAGPKETILYIYVHIYIYTHRYVYIYIYIIIIIIISITIPITSTNLIHFPNVSRSSPWKSSVDCPFLRSKAVTGSLPQIHSMVGTQRYVAPEVLHRGEATARAYDFRVASRCIFFLEV